ncbi:hypothetical protein KZZ52_22065 [Dactylosporangium sp. AC04546]|uniref:hypothetical protein n=1 Tax=Dactylosporangium sp. AC04546 TaxID=2862460 RepID=UPI001EDF9AAE|nr:hypothetical protein [Dactylosporangium sp. AC04546]WVK87966.1 hypothetical protein KZZ52_22065 [Dactylosporangium sp. AC04546]
MKRVLLPAIAVVLAVLAAALVFVAAALLTDRPVVMTILALGTSAAVSAGGIALGGLARRPGAALVVVTVLLTGTIGWALFSVDARLGTAGYDAGRDSAPLIQTDDSSAKPSRA